MVRKRNSLTLKLVVPFTLLLLVTMGGLGFFLTTFIQRTYIEILEKNLLEEAQLVADRLSVQMDGSAGDQPLIEDRTKLYSRALDVRMTVIDAQGNVLAESYTDASEMENHLERPEVQRALHNQASSEMRYSTTLQTDMLYAAAPIIQNGKITGVARLAVSLRAIQRNQAVVLQTIIGATAAATLVAVLMAVVIAMYTIQPLQRLTFTAQEIANGNLGDISPVHRQDEIGQLQHAVHDMAVKLRNQIDALGTERSKLEVVLANMTDGVIIVDSAGFVQLINTAAQRMFQIQVENAIHRSLIETVRHHQLVELWRKSALSGEQETLTLETSPDRLFVQGIATPLNESLPGMTLLVFQDLTRVRRLETVRRDFVSNVSHELRTPLASLKALAETLQEGALEDPPAARRFLQRMEIEIDNLTQIVRELLELSKIESNKVPLQRISVTPCELASPAVERMQMQAERAGLKLEMSCPNDLPAVRADPDRVEQVLVNLIHNAIKFTPPGGQIKISSRLENQFVVFAVQDSGVGIPPDSQGRIFERFYKADRSRSGGGTGLGLSIARHIIEAHGGRIWVESNLNEGSTFYFTLPLA
jgi:two-component system, OmpR family, phosphate regulon sensor histidine kinase PhoR